MNVIKDAPVNPVFEGSCVDNTTTTVAKIATTESRVKASHLWIIARRYAGRCELSSRLLFFIMPSGTQPNALNVARPLIVSRK
jgi:hypothetical protein